MSEKRFAAVDLCLDSLEEGCGCSKKAIRVARAELTAAKKLLAVAPANAAQQAQPEMPTVEECVAYYQQHTGRGLPFADFHIITHIHEFIRRHIGR